MTLSARILDAAETQLSATIDGAEWSGIRCHRDGGGTLIIDGDGEIPNAVKSWLAGGGVPTPYTAPAVTVDQVVAERERRLSLGFTYNFGNGRGAHRIGMSAADMIGWDEVTKSANALINLGAPATPMPIVTDTGPVTVTAMEWQAVLVAATQFRQPIWMASFALQALALIPSDYADDSHWA